MPNTRHFPCLVEFELFDSITVFSAMHGTDKLVFLDKPFTTEPLAWAIRKNDPDFLKFLNDFLEQIKNDGRFNQIYDKWFKHVR